MKLHLRLASRNSLFAFVLNVSWKWLRWSSELNWVELNSSVCRFDDTAQWKDIVNDRNSEVPLCDRIGVALDICFTQKFSCRNARALEFSKNAEFVYFSNEGRLRSQLALCRRTKAPVIVRMDWDGNNRQQREACQLYKDIHIHGYIYAYIMGGVLAWWRNEVRGGDCREYT